MFDRKARAYPSGGPFSCKGLPGTKTIAHVVPGKPFQSHLMFASMPESPLVEHLSTGKACQGQILKLIVASKSFQPVNIPRSLPECNTFMQAKAKSQARFVSDNPFQSNVMFLNKL